MEYTGQQALTYVAIAIIIVSVILIIIWMTRCRNRKDGFYPVQVSPCGPPYGAAGDEYGVDNSGRNSSGTTVWPSSSLSRVAEGFEGGCAAGSSNPAYQECVANPGDPEACGGYLEGFRGGGERDGRRATEAELVAAEDPYNPSRPYGNDAATLRSGIARARMVGSLGGQLSPLAFTDVDSDFTTGTKYSTDALKESMTSERAVFPNELTASKDGLGSTRIDPRFEPGPEHTWGIDATWAQGGAAGGPTSGSFMPTQFGASPYMASVYTYGFGDSYPAGYKNPEAVTTGDSRWNVGSSA